MPLRRLRLAYIWVMQKSLSPTNTEHLQNLEASELKFGKRWIIVQVPSVEFFQLEKIFTFPFFLTFFNIPPGKLARTAFLITFVGQILDRNRLAQTSLESCREVCRNIDTVSWIVPAKDVKWMNVFSVEKTRDLERIGF